MQIAEYKLPAHRANSRLDALGAVPMSMVYWNVCDLTRRIWKKMFQTKRKKGKVNDMTLQKGWTCAQYVALYY